MNRANIYSAIALAGAIGLLAGCDGNESTDQKNNQTATTSSITSAASSSKANTIEDCSLAPGAPACYSIKDSECLLENCEPDYRVMDACGVSKLPKNLEASMIKGGASDCGPLPSSSEGNSSESNSSSSVQQCSNQQYTSVCYAITPKDCEPGNCTTNYRVLNDCGIKNLSPTFSAKYIKSGDYNCGPDSSSSSSSSTPILGACKILEGRTYFTTTVEESGRGANGIAMHHWSISFKEGELHLRQSDFGLTGTYSCQGEQVIATINHGTPEETTLAFNKDFSELAFNPLGNTDLTYRHIKLTETAVTACEDVQGHTYTSAAHIDANDLNLENGPTLLTFNADGNSAIFGYGDIREAGHYDCDLGTLHLHLNGKNANPISIDVETKGLAITLQDKNQTVLTRQQEPTDEEPVFCTQQYDPVCAAFDTGLRCITTPCDTFVYKTYGNACTAGAAKSEVLFKGECGDKEGKPVQEDPIICPANYAPVCAKTKANIQCITTPCPSHEYKTFGNACAANGLKAMISFDAECDAIKLENTLSFEQTPVHLYGVGAAKLNTEKRPNSAVTVIDASIKEDVLTVTLGYSGCTEQPISYNVDAKVLSKSLPAQVIYSFSKQQEDLCEAYFKSTYQYDLLPLRANFRAQVEGDAGLAILGMSVIYKRKSR